MDFEYLYHGSPFPLNGDTLRPRKPRDHLGARKENLVEGVYAATILEIAIAHAITRSPGVSMCRLHYSDLKPFYATIFEGWPQQDHFYLHKLSRNGFSPNSPSGIQWISPRSVKPVNTEVLKIEDFLHLIKIADFDEKVNWIKKHNLVSSLLDPL